VATIESTEQLLRDAARRAYERGRLQGAAGRGAGACLLALPGFLACGRTPAAAACLAGFVLAVTLGRWRGEGYEEGVRAGIVAGILPCLIPSALRLVDGDLCDLLLSHGPWLCALGGIAAGLVLGWRSRPSIGSPFWASAIVTLALAAALGCIPAGALGFAGLLAGVVAGGLPALALRRQAL
jgi:hypothetical protein